MYDFLQNCISIVPQGNYHDDTHHGSHYGSFSDCSSACSSYGSDEELSENGDIDGIPIIVNSISIPASADETAYYQASYPKTWWSNSNNNISSFRVLSMPFTFMPVDKKSKPVVKVSAQKAAPVTTTTTTSLLKKPQIKRCGVKSCSIKRVTFMDKPCIKTF